MPSVGHHIILPWAQIKAGADGFRRWENTTNGALVGAGTNYPIGFTYAEVVRIIWGVKDWRFTIGCSGNFTFNSAPSESLAFTMQFTHRTGKRHITTLSNAGKTSEIDFVNKSEATLALDNFVQSSGDNIVEIVNVRYTETGTVNGYIFGGLYYPQLRMTFGMNDPLRLGGGFGLGIFLSPTSLTAGQTLGGPSVDGPSNPTDFVGTFFGKSFIYHQCPWWNGSVPAGAEREWNGSTTWVVDSVSYWEYDPGDGGGPVWDATDGSQLRFDLPGLA